MQFDLRRFIASGRAGWEQTFDCDLSGRDFAGARIDKPVTARFTAQAAGGDEVRMSRRGRSADDFAGKRIGAWRMRALPRPGLF